jgi:hypothetical protein
MTDTMISMIHSLRMSAPFVFGSGILNQPTCAMFRGKLHSRAHKHRTNNCIRTLADSTCGFSAGMSIESNTGHVQGGYLSWRLIAHLLRSAHGRFFEVGYLHQV